MGTRVLARRGGTASSITSASPALAAALAATLAPTASATLAATALSASVTPSSLSSVPVAGSFAASIGVVASASVAGAIAAPRRVLLRSAVVHAGRVGDGDRLGVVRRSHRVGARQRGRVGRGGAGAARRVWVRGGAGEHERGVRGV